MAPPRVTQIAAVGPGRIIGDGRSMPWHIPEDLKHFKRTTMGHPMVMGRRTFETMGALPGRRSIVLSRDPSFAADGVEVAGSLDAAVQLAASGEGGEDVFIVGGGEIYRLAMDRSDRLIITEVHQSPGVDLGAAVTYPPIDPKWWVEVERVRHDDRDVVTHERRRA